MNASKDADTYETIAAIQFLLYVQETKLNMLNVYIILHIFKILSYALHIITLGKKKTNHEKRLILFILSQLFVLLHLYLPVPS